MVKYSSFNVDKINNGKELPRFLCEICEIDSVCPKYKDGKGLSGALECLDFKLNAKFEVNLNSILKSVEPEIQKDYLEYKTNPKPECVAIGKKCATLNGHNVCVTELESQEIQDITAKEIKTMRKFSIKSCGSDDSVEPEIFEEAI
jgi:hypothetical protein